MLSVIFLSVVMLIVVAPITHMHTTFHVGEATTATTTTTATTATTTTTAATAGQVQIVKHRSDFFHSNQTFVWVNPTLGVSTLKLFTNALAYHTQVLQTYKCSIGSLDCIYSTSFSL
jgi:hypothetical protein